MEDLFTFSGGFSLDLIFNVFLYSVLGLLYWQSSILKFTRQRKDNLEGRVNYLSKLIDLGDSVWIVWNLNDQTFIISGGVQALFGQDSEETLSLDEATEIFGKEVAAQVRALFQKFIETPQSYNEVIDLEQKGRKFELSIRALDQQSAVIWVKDVTSEIIDQSNVNKRITSLLEERQRYRAILDTLPYPIWYRTQDGNVTFHNAAYGEMDDMSHMGESDREQSLWSDMEIAPSRVESVMVPGRMVHRRHVVIDGRRVLLEMHEVSAENEKVGFAIELTQLEESKKELSRHIQAHRQVLENLSVGITIYGADKRLVFFNHAYARTFEFDESFLHAQPSLGEVLENLRGREMIREGMNFPEQKKKLYQQFTSLISPVQELDYLPDGRTIRFITAPHPLGGIFFVHEDVTDSLELERKYNTQIAVQKETFNALHEGVAVFGSDNKLQIVNEEFLSINDIADSEAVSGITISEVMDVNKNKVVLNEPWEDYKRRVLKAVTQRTPRSIMIQLKDERTLNFRYLPLINGANLFSVIDVTDRLKIEEVLKNHNTSLRMTNKMKTEFIENICYLFERPLQRLLGYAKILSRSSGKVLQTMKEPLDQIEATAIRLNFLVGDLRDLADYDVNNSPVKLKSIDLNTFVDEFVYITQDIFVTHQLSTASHITHSAVNVSIDEARVRRALLRLFTSVVQKIPPKSCVHFVTEHSHQSGQLIIRFPATEALRHMFQKMNPDTLFQESVLNAQRLDLPLLSRVVGLIGGSLHVSEPRKTAEEIVLTIDLPSSAA